MEAVEGTKTEFKCKKTDHETVTITITEHNTSFIVSCSPQNSDIVMTGNVVTIKVGSSTKTVTLGHTFNGSGGRYEHAIAGSAGGSFNRRVMQPLNNLPAIRHYTFHAV